MQQNNINELSKVLVLGAAGQLGLAIIQALNHAKINYTAITKQQLDITEQHILEPYLASIRPQIIINCAAYTAVDKAENERVLCDSVNNSAVAYLAQYCKSYGAILLHFSTDYVFDGKKHTPYTESDVPNPVNYYGTSKLAGERAIQYSGCQSYIFRTSWLYNETGKNFYTTMQKLAATQQLVQVVNDQVGAPTHVQNLADMVIKVLHQVGTKQQLHYGIYHYCDDEYLTWFEFAQKIFSAQQSIIRLVPISTAAYGAIAARPKNSRLNCEKINAWLASLTE